MECLAGCAFNEVVEGAGDDDVRAADEPADVAEIGMGDVLELDRGAFAFDADEEGIVVSTRIGVGDGRRRIELIAFDINCREDAALDGEQMGGEDDAERGASGTREFLLNFGCVAV